MAKPNYEKGSNRANRSKHVPQREITHGDSWQRFNQKRNSSEVRHICPKCMKQMEGKHECN